MSTSALKDYLAQHKAAKTVMNCFLQSGNNANGKVTMLSGKIKDFDDVCIILDDCLITIAHMISITPSKSF